MTHIGISYFVASIAIQTLLKKLKELKQLDGKVVTEIEDYYKKYLCPTDVTDFNSSRSENEFEILNRCINLIPYDRNNKISQLAVISFYYLVVVSEYYVYIHPINIIGKKEMKEYNTIIMEISCSNEEWASKIRRLVYKL